MMLEKCPDCGVELPVPADPEWKHRYIGASASCWQLFSGLANGGQPPIAPAPMNNLFVDAYAAQHHGTPSPQAIRSVAIHGLVLYGVFEQGVAPANAAWIRQRCLRPEVVADPDRYAWLTPTTDYTGCTTIADIAAAPTPIQRTQLLEQYIRDVWQKLATPHLPTFADWYQTYIL